VDDHLLEPLDLFESVPQKHRDAVPQVVPGPDGVLHWQVDGKLLPIAGINAAMGRPMSQWIVPSMSYDDMRPAIYDVDARVRDMDLNGVWASLNFSSATWGFAGTVLSKMRNQEAGYAAVQRYNDWMMDEWCGSHPDRFIPCQLPWMADPVLGAQEIRRNAARGCRSVSFSENPYGLGFPDLYSDHWDPFLAACEETGTVLNLHIGSSGQVTMPSPMSPPVILAALFPVNGIEAMFEWVYSKVLFRFPDLRIALSEAGASWVPMALERMRRSYRNLDMFVDWTVADGDPADLVRRNFWFASIEDPAAFRLLDVIGEDRVMVETDYPHPDSSWPDSQALFRDELVHLPSTTIAKVCYETAAALYDHPLPPVELIAASEVGQRADMAAAV
jgi:predicted TIM-barrel fold metal-dependent hydrolase